MRPIKHLLGAAVDVVTESVQAYPRVFHGLRNGMTNASQVALVEACNVVTTLTMATQSSLQFAHRNTPVVCSVCRSMPES
eukprot:m.887313 g.887313  ORF g.887313 m.887313 type:complete len:80 (-) comp59917_c0_seq16:367-606(-)